MTRRCTALLALLFALPAQADEAGEDWLRRIDSAAAVSDAHLRLLLQVTDAQGKTAEREIEIWQKGTDKRLVRMVSPARLKGVGLLVGAQDTLHLFLPSYPPSRRVIGSKRADAFMGTDFAIEDLSRMTYAGRFDTAIMGAEGPLTRLELTPSGSDSPTQQLWVATSGPPIVHRIDHLDGSGGVSRRLSMEDFRAVGGIHIAHQMTVLDLAHGRITRAEVVQIETETDLQDRIFTVTHLEHP